MEKDNIIKNKSYQFALDIIKVHQILVLKQKEYVLSKQLLKSATSIGANLEEANGSFSKKEFFAKISISYKEARESRYWLNLLKDSYFIKPEKANDLISQVDEIIRVLISIQKTLKRNLEKKSK